MKQLLLAVSLFTAGHYYAQSDQENLRKYWNFRNDFKEHFVRIGTDAGQSLPAGAVQPNDCVDNDFSDGPVHYGCMHWGDGMIRHGHYLSLLATEYKMLKNAGLNVNETLNELYYALQAINRVDLKAEPAQGQFYFSNTLNQNLNGFYLREDVGEDFGSNNWGSTDERISCVNSVFYKNNNVLKENGVGLFAEGNSYQNVPSNDQLTSLMVGFSLIYELVDDVYVKPTADDHGFYIIQETQAIVDRMIRYLEERNWFIIDVNGWPVANGGGDLFITGYPIVLAAEHITNNTYNWSIDRRLKGYQDFQTCMTGYGVDGELSQIEQSDFCDSLSPNDHSYMYNYLYGAGTAGTDNNQNSSIFMDWQAGGTGANLDMTHNLWLHLLPNGLAPLYNDWEDDHYFNSTFDGILGDIEIDNLNWDPDNNWTIMFNCGVISGQWDVLDANEWANATGNRELELINALLRGEAPLKSKAYYRAFLDSMQMDGAYALRGSNWISETEDYKAPHLQVANWDSEYRWTDTDEPNTMPAIRGIFSNMDYMVYHNLYRLIFENSSPKDDYLGACICPQESVTIDPNWSPEVQTAYNDLNQRLTHLGFCKDAFEEVNQDVTATFAVEPHFSDYTFMGIYPTQTQLLDATVENGGIALVKTKLVICEGRRLTVQAGGRLDIDRETVVLEEGKIDNYGDIYVKEGARLEVRGELILRPGSTFTIEDGAEVVFEEASAYAILTYFAGAQMQMLGVGSELIVKGRIQVNGQTTFQVLQPNDNGHITIVGNSDFYTFSAVNGPSSFLFKGKGENTDFLTLAGEIYAFAPNIDRIIFRDCKITYESGAHLEMKRPVSFIHTVNEAEDAIGGITVYSDNSFNYSKFYNVPIIANLNYFDTDELYANNCTFEFNEDIEHPYGGNLITVTGQNYRISNSVFHGRGTTCISASLGIYPSTVTNCTFTHFDNTNVLNTLIGINDHSNVELKVKNSGFSNLLWGIGKVSGKLSLRCNHFSGNRYHNILATAGATLNMSNDDNLNGYNVFETTSEEESIEIDASKITLNNGRNYIHTGTEPVIVGTTNTYGYPGLYNPLLATHNQWASGASVPPGGTFDLTTANGYGVDVDASNPELMPACGFHDGDTGPITEKSLATDNDGMAIIAFQGDSVRLDSAIYDAMSYLTAYNSAGNDFEVISRLDEALNQNELDVNDPVYGNLIPFAVQQMKLALESLYQSGQLNPQMNAGSYEANTRKYADALVLLNSITVDETNYRKQFYYEMDKVQLFRMLDRHDISVEIMQNLETCGLDFAEQQYLNTVKESTLREIELQALVLADSTVAFDSIPVDTGSFQTPVFTNQSGFSFGADISDLNNITYPNCDFYNMKSGGAQQNDMQVFPNPNDGKFVVRLKKGKIAKVVLLDSEGKVVSGFQDVSAHTLEVNLELVPGMYLIEVSDEDGKLSHGRIVVQ